MNTFLTMDEIRKSYPEEWVLLGEPKIEAASILGGIVVFHSAIKQGLVAGRDLLKNFEHSTSTFTGQKKTRYAAMGRYFSTSTPKFCWEMKTEIVPFDRQDDESLMVIDFTINNSTLLLAFDTGATHTVIDLTALLLMNISFPINPEISLLEKAKVAYYFQNTKSINQNRLKLIE